MNKGIMEKVNILNQMEQYDFSTPINVTMIFEDSDDESSYKNILKEQHRNDNNKKCKQTLVKIQEKTEKSNTDNVVLSETKSTKEVLCKENIMNTQGIIEIRTHNLPNVKENKLTESAYSMPDITNDSINFETVSHQNQITQNNCLLTKNTSSNICKAPPDIQANETGELSEHVNNLLDVVSENLTMVIKQYYDLYNQNRKSTPAEIMKKMNKYKLHFFDLSYSTVVSIILPQEKNEIFINKFLDKMVDDANKTLQWKCTRRHIDSFYNEMIVWVKHKRNYINSLKDLHDKKNNNVNINDNRLLKDHLAQPPRPLYVAHTTNKPRELGVRGYTPNGADLPSPHDQNMHSDNNMCIFSSGEAGNNISISINPDILVQQTKQYFEAVPPHVNITQSSTNSHIHRTNSPVAPNQVHYDQRFHHIEQNGYPQRSTIHHRPVTSRLPPYHAIHKITNTPTNYKNLQQKNIMQNYQAQQNMNPTAVSVNVNPTLGYNNMYYSQVEERLNTTPVISHVTSLNPNHSPNLLPFSTHGRCGICGKITTLRCSKCQNTYCSYLCQELDVGHKTMCRLLTV